MTEQEFNERNKKLLKQLFKEEHLVKRNDNTYDYNQSLDITEQIGVFSFGSFKDLPYKINTVNGDCSCPYSRFLNLDNCPRRIMGDFDLSNSSMLSDLSGMPEYINGNLYLFYCFGLKDLNSLKSVVNGNIYADKSVIDNTIVYDFKFEGKLIDFTKELTERKSITIGKAVYKFV